MKRILALWLVALLVAVQPCYAVITVGFGQSSDYCADKLGSYSLYYDVDYPNDNWKACISGGTSTVTKTSGVLASSTVNTTSGGTYGVLVDTSDNHYFEIPATGITSTNGRISVKVRTPSSIPANTNISVFSWMTSESAGIKYKIQKMDTNQYRAVGYHYDGSNTVALPGSFIDFPSSSTVLCVLDWNSTTGVVTTTFGSVSGSGTGAISSFTPPSSGVRFGQDTTAGDDNIGLGFDDIYMGASQQ